MKRAFLSLAVAIALGVSAFGFGTVSHAGYVAVKMLSKSNGSTVTISRGTPSGATYITHGSGTPRKVSGSTAAAIKKYQKQGYH